MVKIIYGAAHEQFSPADLLRHAQLAEEAGFDAVGCSDHFQPWWEPGHSGRVYPVIDPEGAIRVYGEHVLPRLR